MIIENKLTRKTYKRLVFLELLLGRWSTPIMLGLYCIAWRVLYSIARVGQLKRNLPVFFGISFILVVMLFYFGFVYRRHMKNSFLYGADSEISIDNDKLTIGPLKSGDNHIYKLKDLAKVKENRKWYFLFFKDKSFLPLSKELEDSAAKELQSYLASHSSLRRTYKRYAAIGFTVITLVGAYYVYTCAVNLNGALAWKLNSFKTDKRIRLKDNNFYTSRLEGIMGSLKGRVDLEPHLMTNSLVVKFKKDGTITSIETYVYGFDKDYKLKSGYLLYYDVSKGSRMMVHKQDWGGQGTMAYNPKNDLSILINILNKMPIEDSIQNWDEKGYAVSYKGIRNWGYNLQGIRFIDDKGNITIPSSASEAVLGPSVSLYSPGREGEITPIRFVYK